MKPAVFVDRDGTLIEERNYLSDQSQIAFTPGAPAAVRALRAAGYALVVVSNQAGIARRLFSEAQVRRVHEHLQALLEREGARVDGFYYCPHHPDFTGPCACRKPEPGMLLQAARDMGLELPESWMVGDRLIDLEAGSRAGLRGSLLVRTGYGSREEAGRGWESPVHQGASGAAQPKAILDDLAGAAQWILEQRAKKRTD